MSSKFPPKCDIELTISQPHGKLTVEAIAPTEAGEWAANNDGLYWYVSHRVTGFRVPRLNFLEEEDALMAVMMFEAAGPWDDIQSGEFNTVKPITEETKQKANKIIAFITRGHGQP